MSSRFQRISARAANRCMPTTRTCTVYRASRVIVVVTLVFFSSYNATTASPGFSGLGVIGANGGSEAHAVSHDGSTVVGRAYIASLNAERAFRWTRANGIEQLGTLPPDPYSRGYDVSSDGAVIVGESISQGGSVRAFRWTAANGMQVLDATGPLTNRVAYGVSGDGLVAVGGSGGQAVRWTPTGMEFLGNLVGASAGKAFDASTGGSVIVGSSGERSFRWVSGSGMQEIAPSGEAAGVSGDGSVVTGFTFNRAFRWTTTGGMQLLNPLDNRTHSRARAVSADGQLIVGESGGSGDLATIWHSIDNSPRNLRDVLIAGGVDMTGWSLRQAFGASGNPIDGYNLVGWGFNPSGAGEAFLATGLFAVPEPSCAAAICILAVAGGSRRTRRQIIP